MRRPGIDKTIRKLFAAKDAEIECLRAALRSVVDSQLLAGPTVLHDKVLAIVLAALKPKE